MVRCAWLSASNLWRVAARATGKLRKRIVSQSLRRPAGMTYRRCVFIDHQHEWLRDKTSRLILDVPAPETPSAFHLHAQRNASVFAMRVRNPDGSAFGING